MDELALVTSLRPAPALDEADKLRRAARMRLAVAYGEPRRRPRRRPVTLAAAATALAGAALTAVMISEGQATPLRAAVRIVTAAWTLRANPDLTVTVTIRQFRDPAGLQRALRQEGVPAIVRYTPMVTEKVGGQEVTGPACSYNWPRSALTPPVTQRAVIVSESEPGPQAQASPVSSTPAETTLVFVFTIRPAAIPAGAVVFLQASMTGPSPATTAPMPSAFGLSLLASDHLPPCVPFSQRHGQADPQVAHPVPTAQVRALRTLRPEDKGLVAGRGVLTLAEGERVRLDAWVEEGDLERALADRAGLADELVQARFGDRAVALVVDVGSVPGARRLPVDPHPEPHGSPWRPRSYHQVQVAGVEAVGDPPVSLVEHDGLPLDCPVTGKRPMVEPQPSRGGIDMPRIWDRTIGRCEVLGALVAEIVLWRSKAGPVGGRLHPGALDHDQVLADAVDSGGGQQLLENHLGLLAWAAAGYAGSLAERDVLLEICRAVQALPPPPGAPSPLDLLLDGQALLITDGPAAAAPTLQRAAKVLIGIPTEDVLRWGWLAYAASVAAWDVEGMHAIASRQAQLARAVGALAELPIFLSGLCMTTTWMGDFAGAAALIAEAESVAAGTGSRFDPSAALRLEALRGRETEASAAIEQAAAGGHDMAAAFAHWAAAVLYNGLGRYPEAASAARHATLDTVYPWPSVWALPELIEAAARVGETQLAHEALQRLTKTTQPFGTDWALGLEARSRALLSEGAAAEPLYREAIDRLSRTRLRPDLARAHLLYGEWLRRERRRIDAREQLRTAHDLLESTGMEAFAERARRELLATGEKVRKRSDEARDELTPQEEQIARLARDGLSNPEIGAQLFISTRTVEWHLRKVFTKLGIASRIGLHTALTTHERKATPP